MLLIDVVLAGVLIVTWYMFVVRLNRQRATQVLRWIERAFAGHASVGGIQWLASTRFRVRLTSATGVFKRASVVVQLVPREPLHWMIRRFRPCRETATFEADLDYVPSFSLEVHNHRWQGTTRRVRRKPKNIVYEHTGPFVITTRNDWQREISAMMSALVASRDCDCTNIAIRRSSPHLSATIPVEAISPGAESQHEFVEILREIATGASTQPHN